MKLRFDATLEDFVDVTVHSIPRSNILSIVISAVVTGVVLGIVIQFLFSNLALAVILGVVLAVYVVVANYNIRERNARKLFVEKYHVKDSVPIEVEISESGLSFNQQGTTTIHDWNTIELMEETDDAVYFKTKFGGYSAVRKRAFGTDDEMNEFRKIAEHYLKAGTIR
ncbi:MAG: YcxB family protein [Pyrinomonadaceae bacterium]